MKSHITHLHAVEKNGRRYISYLNEKSKASYIKELNKFKGLMCTYVEKREMQFSILRSEPGGIP